MDQGPLHKTRFTESNGRESGKEPGRLHRGNFTEQYTNGSGSKTNYRQMGPHKTAKRLEGKGHCP